jgi:C-terminal processing protease CtpA/Prc
MSACDRLAEILKHARRGLLVGGPTEGAGASQQETKEQSARWVDREGWLGVSIPNAAMGVQVTAAAGIRQASAEVFFDQLAFENRPIEPDVAYATTLEDILQRNRGWLRAAREALQRAERPPAPERSAQPR